MPSPLTMRRIIASGTQKSGPPTRGLQGIWFLGRNNLLLDPRDFSSANWTKTRCYIAANCAADPVSGAYTVDKLVEDGTAANTHQLLQGTIPTTATYTYSWVVRGGGHQWILISGWSGGATAYFDLVNGTKGSVSGVTSDMSPIPGATGWYQCSITGTFTAGWSPLLWLSGDNVATYSGLGHQQTCAAGGSTTQAKLSTCALADDALNGSEAFFADAPTVAHTVTDWDTTTKILTFTPARALTDGVVCTVGPGIYIARAQLNAGSTAYDFEDRGTQQTLPIYRGTAGTLQRGATTGAEASDPGLRNDGLYFDTDDYVLGQNLSNVTMAGPFTMYVVGLHNGTGDGTAHSGVAASGANSQYQAIAYGASSGKIRMYSRNTTYNTSADLTVGTASPECITMVCPGAGQNLTLIRSLDGTSVAVANKNPTGTMRLGVGCIPQLTVAPTSILTGYAVALANVAHTAAERARMYNWLKSELAKPPYSLSVL